MPEELPLALTLVFVLILTPLPLVVLVCDVAEMFPPAPVPSLVEKEDALDDVPRGVATPKPIKREEEEEREADETCF